MPKVSVLIASYNHEKYVLGTIRSALAQTFQDFEIVITDDGSSDSSVSEIHKVNDPRISFFAFERNLGAVAATRNCLDHSSGEYIALLNSDDQFLPDKLNKQVSYLDGHREVAAVFSYARIIDDAGKDLSDPFHFYSTIFIQPNRSRFEWLNHFFYRGNCICHPSMLIRRSCYDEIGFYDPRYAQLPDYDFWIRLCLKHEIFIMPEELIKFRIHTTNTSAQRPEVIIRDAWERTRILKHYLKLTDREELLRVFPALNQFKHTLDADVIPFYVALLASGVKTPYHRLFSLNTLYELLENKELQQKLTGLGFSYPDFITMSGEYDIFGFTSLRDHKKASSAAEAIGKRAGGTRATMRPWKVSIIIPLFNKVEFTQKCLESLFQNTPEGLYELIMIDNASTDGTKAFLQSLVKNNVKVIANKNNLGFAKACNQGAQVASTEYVLFLNNDTEPLKGWLEPLLDIVINDDSVAAVGSKLLYPDMTIQHAGIVIVNDESGNDALQARNNHVSKPATMSGANEATLYQALTAACVLVRKEAFRQAGGFDEEYWNGYEDVDLCFKLQEQGNKIVYQPASVIVHHESKSGPERFVKAQDNIVRLHEKWLGKIKPDIILNKDGTLTLTDAGIIRPYRSPETITRSLKPASRPLKNNLVSIVVLTFNQLEHTQLCLKSLERYTPQPYELILVDNGSTDGTPDYLRQYTNYHKNVRVIANKENLGFSAGNNQGLALANGNYLLLLNNDTVVTEGWLARMLSVFDRYLEVGIVGPVSNYVSGPQHVTGASYQSLEEMHHFAKQWSADHKGQTMEFQRVVGFCLLAKREVIDRIGGLDEQFGSGNFEDDDFCLRAAAAGYKARIAQDAYIHHTGSQTFKGARINYQQSLECNWGIFKTKWKLPTNLPYGANYTLNLDTKDLSQYYISLPPRAEIPLIINTTPPEKAEDAVAPLGRLKKKVQSELTAGNWEQAIQLLTEALNLNQTSDAAVSLWNDLGYSYFMANLPQKAEIAFSAGLKIDPQNLDLLNNLASLYLHQEDYDRATDYVNRALRLDPQDFGALRTLGDCAIKLARFDVALRAYEQVKRLSPATEGIDQAITDLTRFAGAYVPEPDETAFNTRPT